MREKGGRERERCGVELGLTESGDLGPNRPKALTEPSLRKHRERKNSDDPIATRRLFFLIKITTFYFIKKSKKLRVGPGWPGQNP